MKKMNVLLNGDPFASKGSDKDVMVNEYVGHDGTRMLSYHTGANTYFAGYTRNDTIKGWLNGDIPNRIVDLAVRAINNRTRERNVARLGESFALGEISDEEYDRIIDENEDNYIIKCNAIPTETELKIASYMASKLMDVNDTDDLAVLFSFDESSIKNYLKQ